jgi:hypothetical protein
MLNFAEAHIRHGPFLMVRLVHTGHAQANLSARRVTNPGDLDRPTFAVHEADRPNLLAVQANDERVHAFLPGDRVD